MLESSLDWLEFTCKTFTNYLDFLELLNFGESEFFQCKSALYGYNTMIKHEEYNIFILFNGSPEMGIHLKVAGHSLDFLFKNLGVTVYEFIEYIRGLGKFTRLDLAMDDIGAEYFTVPDVIRYLKKDQYSTSFKNYSYIRMFETDQNQLCGDTVYLGRRSSDTFFRIYDKRLETIFKLEKDPGSITRWELEAKHDSADKLADLIIEEKHLGRVFFQVLTNSFRLIKKDASRKSRCSTLKRYEEFTQYMESASIGSSKKILTVDQKMSWLMNSCSKSLALANCRDPDFTDKMIQKGFEDLTDAEKNTLYY